MLGLTVLQIWDHISRPIYLHRVTVFVSFAIVFNQPLLPLFQQWGWTLINVALLMITTVQVIVLFPKQHLIVGLCCTVKSKNILTLTRNHQLLQLQCAKEFNISLSCWPIIITYHHGVQTELSSEARRCTRTDAGFPLKLEIKTRRCRLFRA